MIAILTDPALLAKARQELERDAAAYRRRRELWREQLYAMEPRLSELDKQIRAVFLNALARLSPEAMDEAAAASLSLQEQRGELLRAMGASPEAFEDTPFCPVCSDTRMVGGELCECLAERVQALQAEELSSLLNLRGQSFQTFDAGLFSDRYDETLKSSLRDHMEATKAYCVKYCEKFGSSSDNLLFSGPPGTGKTFLSSCIAGAMTERGFSVVYDTAVHHLSHLEAVQFGRGGEESERAVRRIRECSLLIIDDLGTEFLIPSVQSMLLDVINTRLISNKKMLVSTNLTRSEARRRYSPALASRLEGEFLWLEFFGDDLRLREH